jgi:hypothetical protein
MPQHHLMEAARAYNFDESCWKITINFSNPQINGTQYLVER